jgi:hypothetical protein
VYQRRSVPVCVVPKHPPTHATPSNYAELIGVRVANKTASRRESQVNPRQHQITRATKAETGLIEPIVPQDFA